MVSQTRAWVFARCVDDWTKLCRLSEICQHLRCEIPVCEFETFESYLYVLMTGWVCGGDTVGHTTILKSGFRFDDFSWRRSALNNVLVVKCIACTALNFCLRVLRNRRFQSWHAQKLTWCSCRSQKLEKSVNWLIWENQGKNKNVIKTLGKAKIRNRTRNKN